MGDVNQGPPVSAVHEATPSFIARFHSFKDNLSRRSAEKGSNRAKAEAPSVTSSPVPSSPAPGSEVPLDAPLSVERVVVPEQTLEVQVNPSGSSIAPIVISGREEAVESIPPPLKKRETVLGLPGPSAAPLSKGRARASAVTGTSKRKRGAKTKEGEPSGLLSQHRSKVWFRFIRNTLLSFLLR